MRSRLVPLSCVLAFALGFAAPARAADGALDATTFNQPNGFRSIATGAASQIDFGNAVAVAPGDKVVVVGCADVDATATTNRDWVVARFTSAGAPDATFGGGDGFLTLAPGTGGGSTACARDVVVQGDGKIVVVGDEDCTGAGCERATVARFEEDGDLDGTFDGDGLAFADLAGEQFLGGVALDGQGRIVVAGRSTTNSGDFAVGRFLATTTGAGGALDATFGAGGFTISDLLTNSADGGVDLAIDGNGQIVVAGTTGAGAAADFALLRYSSAGLREDDFGGSDDVATMDVSGADMVAAVATAPGGKYVLAGGSSQGTFTGDYAVVRFLGDGSPDNSFSDDGKQTTINNGSVSANLSGVVVTPDGRITASASNGFVGFGLARYRPDGSLDPDFGGGTQQVDTSASSERAFDIALTETSPSKIVVGGSVSNPADLAAARMIFDDTAPNTNNPSGPSGPTADNTPTFTFSSPDPTATFECRLQGGDTFTACSSPATFGPIADGSYAFEVRAKDGFGNTDGTPPAALGFTVDATAPVPVFTGGPEGPANVGQPQFSWTTSPSEAADFECLVIPPPGFPPGFPFSCTSPTAIDFNGGDLPEGAYTFRVTATDAVGNSAQTDREFIVDRTAPAAPVITDGPSGLTNDRTPTFAFAGEPEATFACGLDGSPLGPCSGPGAAHTAASLVDGAHVLAVRQSDAAGNAGTTTTRAFTVDATPPQTAFRKRPPNRTRDRTPTFRFRSDEPGSRFQCKVDRGGFRRCQSPFTTRRLSFGRHTLRVRAIDAAGNVDRTPALDRFTIKRP